MDLNNSTLYIADDLNMVEFDMGMLWFILTAYGLTQILVYSRLFEKIRPAAYFFNCPMCVGFWVGVVLMILNPFTELFTYI